MDTSSSNHPFSTAMSAMLNFRGVYAKCPVSFPMIRDPRWSSHGKWIWATALRESALLVDAETILAKQKPCKSPSISYHLLFLSRIYDNFIYRSLFCGCGFNVECNGTLCHGTVMGLSRWKLWNPLKHPDVWMSIPLFHCRVSTVYKCFSRSL